MREIKFRAYVIKRDVINPHSSVWQGVKEYKDLIKVSGASFINGRVDYVTDKDGNEYSISQGNLISVMQYAGLKDCNGMEIYEGDIVRSMKSGQIGYVFWGRGCYFVKWVKNTLIKEEYESYLWEVRKSIEVIGNQFEHPQLLEETE